MTGMDLPRVSSSTRSDMPQRMGRSDGDQPAGSNLDGERRNGWHLSRHDDRARPGLPSSVIHELRTPLTSIHGYAQVLQRSLQDNPRATNALSVMVRETTRLSAMLAELSELADLQSGESISSPVTLNVEQIVDGVVHEVCRRDGDNHPIQVEGSATVHCNPSLLNQALLHVIANAAAYSPPGSPVHVAIASQGDRVEIVVADEGIGVESADAERIYQPFQRGTNARRTGVRGLGLGLYLAQEALAHDGGTIEHRSADGGTTFRIRLPAG